jgi:DNA-binding MarR family transcriptional regulator
MTNIDEIVIVNNHPRDGSMDFAPMTDILRQRPGYALRRAANAMMGELGRRLATIDLRIAEASVLLLVDNREDATASEIGRVLDIQRANMVPLLGRLEEAGLIARKPIDGKSQAVLLTALGHQRRAQADAITTAFEDDLLGRIAAEHRDHLVPALGALWRAE